MLANGFRRCSVFVNGKTETVSGGTNQIGTQGKTYRRVKVVGRRGCMWLTAGVWRRHMVPRARGTWVWRAGGRKGHRF